MTPPASGGPGPDRPWMEPEEEGEQEVGLHLDFLVEELLAEGWNEEEARREAMRRFGDVDVARRATRAMARRRTAREERMRMWTGLHHDVRQALRRLISEPGYTVTVVATLTLGLGAAALVGALAWGVLLRPLPFPDPDRLVAVWQDNRQEGRPEDLVSPANYTDLRESATSFEELGARLFFAASLVLESEGPPESVLIQRATPSFLRALRPSPSAGRLFTEEEGEVGQDGVVLLTHAFWQERFDADPAVVGRSMSVGGREVTVVGVLPASMRSVNPDVQLWLPLAWDPSVHFTMAPDQRPVGILQLVGRLEPGVGLEGARSELEALAEGLAREFPEANEGRGVTVRGLRDEVVRSVRPALLVFSGALVLLLLIAAVNVTTLQMARSNVRGAAFAVRRALGAGRLRLVRLSALESIIPALGAAILSVVLARLALQAILGLAPASLPREHEVGIDAPIVIAVLVVALVLAILTGLPSALASLRASPTDLEEGARGGSAGRRAQRVRSTLVAAELALSLTLLVGAGLLIRSFQAATAENPGFRHEALLSSYLTVPSSRAGSTEEVLVWYREALEEIEDLPGVAGASLTSRVPLQARSVLTRLDIEGRPVPEQERPEVEFRRVWPGYFEMMGVPTVEGRAFGPDDAPAAEPVAVINEAARRELFADSDPIGQMVHWSADPDDPFVRIVGVVGDVRHFGLDRPPVPELYIASSQAPSAATSVVVRAEGDPVSLVTPLRTRLASLMPDRPAPDVDLVVELARASISDRRFNAVVLGAFAGAALLLALVGTYGVFSYWVSNQRREVGIRMAMGAGPANILRLVLLKSARTVAVGLAIGAAGAALLTRAWASLLYGTAATDPLIFLSAFGLLAGAALAASWLPARRAAAVEPMETLSAE